jgi:hypothetical protein
MCLLQRRAHSETDWNHVGLAISTVKDQQPDLNCVQLADLLSTMSLDKARNIIKAQAESPELQATENKATLQLPPREQRECSIDKE